jgi:hypothetical protein
MNSDEPVFTAQPEDLPPGGDDTSAINIFKKLRDTIQTSNTDDMLDLIPDVYKKSNGSSGKDLIYTDGNGNSRSLTSENPSIENMMEEFNIITDKDPAKQFYLALSRNIQKNFDLYDKTDKDTLLLRLRKNSLLLQLTHTWDYATMGPTLNLFKTNIVYYFIEGDYDNKQYIYGNDQLLQGLADDLKRNDLSKTTTEHYTAIIKNTDIKFTILFQITIEYVMILSKLREHVKLFEGPPYNYDHAKFPLLDNLISKLSFDNFKIGNFESQYINVSNTFFDDRIAIIEWFNSLYEYFLSENFDKIREVDLSKCHFLVLEVYIGSNTSEVIQNLPDMDITNIERTIFAQKRLQIDQNLDAYIKQLKKINAHFDDDAVMKKLEPYKETFKNNQRILKMRRDFRLRKKPIENILNNINAYLNRNEKKNFASLNKQEYAKLNIKIEVSNSSEDEYKSADELKFIIKKIIEEFNNEAKSLDNKCVVFIKMLNLLINSNNDEKIYTDGIVLLFNNLYDIFDKLDCFNPVTRQKIYEYLFLINDILIIIAPDGGKADVDNKRQKIKDMFKQLPILSRLLIRRKRSVRTGDEGDETRSIHNLLFIVKRLYNIIKTCNDEKLKTIFNKFKNNLAYTNVTAEDNDNLKELSKHVSSMQNIMCRDPSNNTESDKKTYITDAIEDVTITLDYINRYTSPGQYEGLGESGKSGGKKHRKRYIKNKQNNNKNDNITMKKQRRNRKRAPVTKTIRNKKEQ